MTEDEEPGRTVFDFEIASYAREIAGLRDDVGRARQEVLDGGNLTHYSLGLSNRANMILVGMCGLVEALLGDLALEHARSSEDREAVLDMDRSRLVAFLKDRGLVPFDRLRHWSAFSQLVVVRNAIAHGHGGIVPRRKVSELKNALRSQRMSNVLVGERRIRMRSEALESCHATVAGLIRELLDARTERDPGGSNESG